MSRVLPDDLYDTLHFSSLAYGGIGGCSDYDKSGKPRCVMGHVMNCGAAEAALHWLLATLAETGINIATNDAVVPAGRRLRFEAWCRRMDVIPERESTATNRAESGSNAPEGGASMGFPDRADANRGAAAVSRGKARNRTSSRTKSTPRSRKTTTAGTLSPRHLREKGWTPHVSGDGRGGPDE